MLIDWFTVIAQVVNFLILVWLMKRFLYKPILNAIDMREKRIAAELADADAKKVEAGVEREAFKRKNDEFDRQYAELLSKATEEAATERQRLLEVARKDAESFRSKQQESLRNEYLHLNEEISRRTRAEVFAITRNVLTDLAGTDLEERMVDVFVRRLRELDSEEKERLAAMLKSPDVLVRSAYELPMTQRALIEVAVKEVLTAGIQIRFETVPDLVSGIELTMLDQKIAWSIADYLASLDKSINELLKEQHKTEFNAGSTPQ